MSSLQMPKVDNSILSKRDQIVSDVEKIVDPKNVLSHIDEIKPYETDALAAYKQVPLMVVLPETVKEVSKILKYCNENKIKVVPRGAGTGLSGGSLPLQDCILLAMGKFNKVLELDLNFLQMNTTIVQMKRWFFIKKSKDRRTASTHRAINSTMIKHFIF